MGLVLVAGLSLASAPAPGAPVPADLVLEGGRIYTMDPARSLAAAVAVREGRITYVGSGAGAKAWIGPQTRVEELGGRLLLPGLIDAHIHPLDIVDLDVCDLASRALNLAELSAFVAACVAHYAPAPGSWLLVHQWAYAAGNQPDARFPTLRAALDAASTQVRIQLLGNDGHHYAFNSPALAQVADAGGHAVGFSKATLGRQFTALRPFVGVDALGEPNGAVNEDATERVHPGSTLYDDLTAIGKVPERIPQRLNSVGITGVLDAMVSPQALPLYDTLAARAQLTARVTVALFFDPSKILARDGRPDYDRMVAEATRIRTRYADNPLIKADVVKLFADGGLEGNPYAVPPTLPNAAALKPFLQPIFARDSAGRATVTGYVDTASALCAAVRAHPKKYASAAAIGAFTQAHGYHPGQCAIFAGELQHPRAVLLEFVRRMHLAGFSLHIHVISDRTARTALDALEAARAADGNSGTRDALAHLQLAAPQDVARIGRDHLYVAFTYSWMDTEPEYDLNVIPFFQKVHGNSYQGLHRPGSYYESNAYPVRAVQAAGGILTAGSDAPVESRDPRPFVNMAMAITRALPGQPPLNPQQSISVRDVIEAYTVNGARLLGWQQEAGSIEVGKSADFVLIDHDILALADEGHPQAIADTRVLATWFRGIKVYARAVSP